MGNNHMLAIIEKRCVLTTAKLRNHKMSRHTGSINVLDDIRNEI